MDGDGKEDGLRVTAQEKVINAQCKYQRQQEKMNDYENCINSTNSN